MNCWEFKKCGREKGGSREKEMGVCPAYPDHGNQCDRIAGTFCDGKLQGVFAMKLLNCTLCDFYNSPHHKKP